MTDTQVLADGLHFGEGPRWHDGRFWVSDFYSHAVISVDMAGDVRTEVEMDDQPSGLGWLPDGRLLISSMTRRAVVRREPDGSLATHADLSAIATFHVNDMLVDDEGRAYIGNFGFDLDAYMGTYGVEGLFGEPGPVPASLAMVSPDGSAQAVANGLVFPNGMVLTPDGSTLIVAETLASRLTAFDRRPDGTLANRRLWAALGGGDGPVVPDGICLDAEGAIWVSNPLAPAVLRVAEGGEVLAQLTTSQPSFACMLGGPEGRHLLVCTAPSAGAAEASAARHAKLEVVEVGAPRAGLP